MKTIILFIQFLFFLGMVDAQETITSKELIGTWTYIGPNKPILNDTIILTRNLANTKTFTHWTFKSQDNTLEKYSNVLMKLENDSTRIISVKSVGIKWYIFSPNLLVIESNNDQQNFRLAHKTRERIKFIKIK
jgi:hypothetical protein